MGCRNLVLEDELDSSCSMCGYIFCGDHMDYCNLITQEEVLKRQDQIHKIFPNDSSYLKRVDEQVKTAMSIEMDKVHVKDILSIPICPICMETR